jgi:hypothetical protein
VSIQNPTAREYFSADPEILGESVVEQMEDNFFFLLRLPNGTKKTTYRNRLDDVALACNRLLNAAATPIRVMDVGISSGITTKEWMKILDRLNRPYCMHAIDLCLYGVIESLGKHFHVLRDSSGEALQYEIWGWALANHYGYGILSRLKRLIPVSLARIASAVGCLARRSSQRKTKEVTLVTRGLENSDRLRLHEADIFQVGQLGETFHLIRAANILNRAYFSEAQLKSILQQLQLCMEVGSYLVVVRTRDDRSQNDGTVFIMEASGKLRMAERFGAGSEVEPIVLGMNC